MLSRLMVGDGGIETLLQYHSLTGIDIIDFFLNYISFDFIFH